MSELKYKKKVLIVDTVGLGCDGITNIITSYVELIDKHTFEIYIIGAEKSDSNIIYKLKKNECHVVEFPSRKNNTFLYFIKLVKYIKNNKIDIIHVHGNSATMAIDLLAAFMGGVKKRIAHSHNTQCTQKRVNKILHPLFDVLYTDAVACGDEAGKWLFNNNKFTVLKNGRNIEQYRFKENERKEIRNNLGLSDNLFAIGHVGGFVEQKNQEFIVEIIREIVKYRSDIRMFFAGDGEMKHLVQAKIEEYKLEKYVTFVGNIDWMSGFLSAMDCMVLPSKFEGVPLVAIEWQIAGIKSILSTEISDECALTESVFFLKLDDGPSEWAKLIVNILENRINENRKDISEHNMVKIRKNGFDIMESIKGLEKIYLS